MEIGLKFYLFEILFRILDRLYFVQSQRDRCNSWWI